MSRTVQEVKEGLALEKQIKQTLIDQANATTGKEDTTLTSAVGSLVEKCSSGGGITPSGTIEITENGTYDVTNYASASVDVQGGGSDSKAEYLLSQASTVYWLYNNELIEVELDCKNLKGAGIRFQGCENLKTVKLSNTGNITNFNYLVNGCGNLESLEEIDFSGVTTQINNSMFSQSSALNNKFTRFIVVPNTIKVNADFVRAGGLLDDESRQSIIDGLADLTGQTAQTLTLHADVKAKLTEEQIATITSKNWTLA